MVQVISVGYWYCNSSGIFRFARTSFQILSGHTAKVQTSKGHAQSACQYMLVPNMARLRKRGRTKQKVTFLSFMNFACLLSEHNSDISDFMNDMNEIPCFIYIQKTWFKSWALFCLSLKNCQLKVSVQHF
jgi:hypothetical protein